MYGWLIDRFINLIRGLIRKLEVALIVVTKTEFNFVDVADSNKARSPLFALH